MKIFLRFLAFLSLFIPLLAFDCDSVSDNASCDQLSGCTWTASACSGSFTPSCSSKNCFYIDPTSGSDSQDGSVQNPFKTLTQGFKSLSSKNGSLVIINYDSEPEVEILGYAIITSFIDIKPLFEKNSYILSLSQFDTSTLSASNNYPAISITSGKLDIYGLTINRRSTKASVETLFHLGSAQLSFHNVIVRDGGTTTQYLINTTSASAQFNFTEGACIRCNWLFELLEGNNTLRKILFTDIQTTSGLINAGETLYINDTILTGATGGEVLFLNMQMNSTLYIQNVTVEKYSGNFIDADSMIQLTVASSTFRNLDIESSIPFIRVRRFNGNLLTMTGLYFKDLIFENIKVKNSLFLMDDTMNVISMINFTVSNLFKKPVVVKTAVEIDYETSWPGGIFFLGRNDVALRLDNSRFYNIGSHCMSINTGGIYFTNSIFDNSKLDPADAVQAAVDENDDFGGITWVTIIGGSDKISSGSTWIITSNIWNHNGAKASLGGALRLRGLANTRPTMTNNTFNGLQAFYGGAIYYDNPWTIIVSTNEVFSENSATVGGAIYKFTNGLGTNTTRSNLMITGATFQGNSALDKGGAIFLDNEEINLVNTVFRNNQATFGGAICFLNRKINMKNLNYFQNNTWIANTATKSGGALKLLFPYEELNPIVNDTSVFINNTDPKGQAIDGAKLAAYRFSFYEILGSENEKKNLIDEDLERWVSNKSLTKVSASFNVSTTAENPLENFTISHKSGHVLDQIFVIEIYDQNDVLADYIDDESLSINIISTQNSINSFQAYLYGAPLTFTFSKGKIYMKTDVTLIGQPNTRATLSFSSIQKSYSFVNKSELLLSQPLQINFRNCDLGDIFNSQTKICETCPENTYSLVDPYLGDSCLTCDAETSICLGGTEIAPQPGYWRYDIATDRMLECPKSSACLGGFIDEKYDAQGQCVFPYEGNLCSQCAQGYAKASAQSETCINCSIDVLYYLKSIGFLLQQIITAFYSVRTNIKDIREMKKDNKLNKAITEKQTQSNILRIAINYIQTFSLLLQLKFEWPTLISDILGLTTNIAPTNQSGFSFDCLIILIRGTNEDLYFINIVIRLIKPFCMWLLLCFLDFLWNLSRHGFKKALRRVKSNSIILFLIPAFMYQTSIIQATFELFRCQNFSSSENPVYFMVENPQVQCWNSSHLFWSLIIGLPNLIVWSLLLPFILFSLLWKKAKQLRDPQVYAEYSFIYVGLKPNRFYWEFLTLLRKVLIVVAFVFLNIISIPTQVFVIFLIIVAFGYLQFVFQPYSNPKMNTLEMYSFLILGITTCSSMTLLPESRSEGFSLAMIILSCVLNILFFIALAFYFVKNYKSKAKKHVKAVQTIFRKITQSVSSLQKTLSSSSLPSATTRSKSEVYKIDPPNPQDFDLKTTERNLNIEEDEEGIRNTDNLDSPVLSPPRMLSSGLLSPRSDRASSTYRDDEVGEDDEFIFNPGSPQTHTRNRPSRVDLISLMPIARIEESPHE